MYTEDVDTVKAELPCLTMTDSLDTSRQGDLPPAAADPLEVAAMAHAADRAQLTRLYGAYAREWEAVDLASFRLRSDRSAALCKTKSDKS
jgi:hypothetical protein